MSSIFLCFVVVGLIIVLENNSYHILIISWIARNTSSLFKKVSRFPRGLYVPEAPMMRQAAGSKCSFCNWEMWKCNGAPAVSLHTSAMVT